MMCGVMGNFKDGLIEFNLVRYSLSRGIVSGEDFQTKILDGCAILAGTDPCQFDAFRRVIRIAQVGRHDVMQNGSCASQRFSFFGKAHEFPVENILDRLPGDACFAVAAAVGDLVDQFADHTWDGSFFHQKGQLGLEFEPFHLPVPVRHQFFELGFVSFSHSFGSPAQAADGVGDQQAVCRYCVQQFGADALIELFQAGQGFEQESDLGVLREFKPGEITGFERSFNIEAVSELI